MADFFNEALLRTTEALMRSESRYNAKLIAGVATQYALHLNLRRLTFEIAYYQALLKTCPKAVIEAINRRITDYELELAVTRDQLKVFGE